MDTYQFSRAIETERMRFHRHEPAALRRIPWAEQDPAANPESIVFCAVVAMAVIYGLLLACGVI